MRSSSDGPGVSVGEVGGEHLGADAGVVQLVGQLGELVGAAGHERDAVTRRASSRASSTPMPDDAPVTTAVRSRPGAGRLMAATIGPAPVPRRADRLALRSPPMAPKTDWNPLLREELAKPYWAELQSFVAEERAQAPGVPEARRRLRRAAPHAVRRR